jgi:hypothetical protein
VSGVELVVGELRVFRGWSIGNHDDPYFIHRSLSTPNIYPPFDPTLHSLGVDYTWRSKKETATCIKGHESAPILHCTCGFYGYYEPNWLSQQYHHCCTGVVKASGRVILGSKGIRAEHMEIEALSLHVHSNFIKFSERKFSVDTDISLLRMLFDRTCAAYEIPNVYYDFKEMLYRHPVDDPSNLFEGKKERSSYGDFGGNL